MKITYLKFTIIICITIVFVQTAFMIIPQNAVTLYNIAFRPLVYAVLAASLYVFKGRTSRPANKAHQANMIAVLSIVAFGVVIMILSFVFGAGVNIMMLNQSLILHNLWEFGSIVILGEYIRFKLIGGVNKQYRVGTIIALTIVLAYGQMNTLRILIQGDAILWAVFFEAVFRPLIVSAASSGFAIAGSFAAVLIISFVYTMSSYIIPILPNISPIAWSLVISGLTFITIIAYYNIINEKKRSRKALEKRAYTYMKNPLGRYIAGAILVSGALAFTIGLFPFYPLVILTGSMSGTFERGSIVIVERVPSNEVLRRVDEGEIIHFISRGRVEFVHRVIDFAHDDEGERQYITRGDANELTDPFPVPQQNVLGVVHTAFPFLGYPYLFFQSVFRLFDYR